MAETFVAEASVALDFVPDAVLFDMDGLMLDSERAMLETWREAAAAENLAADDAVWLAMVGMHDRASLAHLSGHFGSDAAVRLRDTSYRLYDARVAAGLPRKRGLLELLDLLDARGVPKAVATSTQRPRALAKLAASGLIDRFDAIVAGSDVEHPKPAPDIYLLAARELGVDVRRCVVLEDSEPGVRAALAAGATPIQVPDLVVPGEELRAFGHRIVASLEQARSLLERVLANKDAAQAG
ncbi:HAD family hydrolase [Lysobacter enzymogenes]|uniref:HAD family hydrolase n=1 Tax=Lysobacter enzymogenes TaxID=69 RepID=UPI0008980F1A|nr:HAD family phosphatase [Lysobacter enzymogenes]SDY26032.1 haloacid dehalogenase superfamily, subfamily IA, variant 3 with third motif having DD or ED [Lysobacter enzymogenes]